MLQPCSERKAARSSSEKSWGSSHAAKGPPRSALLKYMTFGVPLFDPAARRGHEQIRVDAQQFGGRLARHKVCDRRADIAALCDVARIPEALHQLGPRGSDAGGVPAEFFRLSGKAVAGKRRQNEMERLLGPAALRGRVGERTDGFQSLIVTSSHLVIASR